MSSEPSSKCTSYGKGMSSWKNRLVVGTMVLLGASFPLFLATGYTALYWAWPCANLRAALPYLPAARNFGMLAVAGAAAALGIVFLPSTFPLPPKTRLSLSLLATVTIAFFSEFRNEGKFYFKTQVHFFGPTTWIHHGLNQLVSSLGDSLYRIEYSHWNDFLMGPAIVSVLFPVAFLKIYGAVRSETISLRLPASDVSALDHSLRFARILMNVGLFWFFISAWAEKAGYLTNSHSNDEVDLPFEFAGTVVGFWMARALTKPFDKRVEKFRSTFFVDVLSSGVIGLLYTLVVGSLTEGVASAVGHALYPVVPGSLDIHEYTPLQQHMRPFELLLLAGAMWWSLSSMRSDDTTFAESDAASKWRMFGILAVALGAATAYLLVIRMMFSLLEPEGLVRTLATVGAGIGIGMAAYLFARRSWQERFTTVLGRGDEKSRD